MFCNKTSSLSLGFIAITSVTSYFICDLFKATSIMYRVVTNAYYINLM